MNFQQDLFISYAHLDNQPLPPSKSGWITRFHQALQTFVSTRLGAEVRIWRDDKLSGSDIFSRQIVDQFRKTALLVSILTPRYVQSEWCSREMREFCEAARETGGVVVDNKSRVIKIVKTPIESDEMLPAVAKEVLGYEFFTRQHGEAPMELDTTYGEEFQQAYYRKIAQLAWDIKQILDRMKSVKVSESSTNGHKPRNVYLAPCGDDVQEDREHLMAELKTHGYGVLPSVPLPTRETAYVEAVEGSLRQSDLAVHLIGSDRGSIIDGPSRKSGAEIQNELAAGRSRAAGLRRVIWLPRKTAASSDEQRTFVDALEADPVLQHGADLITGDFERLRAAVHGELKGVKTGAPAIEVKDRDDGAATMVYVICNKDDRKATVALRKFLRECGVEVEIPAFEGNSAAVRESNERMATGCDAIIVFYGAGDDAWKRSIDNDLKKMVGYRRDKPLRATFTYLADPRTGDKEDLIDLETPNLIDGFGGFSSAKLAPFLAAVGAGGKIG